MDAVGKWLDLNKTPGRKVNQIDNRGSNFYVALYWAEEMAAKDQAWAPLAQALKDNEEQILKVCLSNVLMISGILSSHIFSTQYYVILLLFNKKQKLEKCKYQLISISVMKRISANAYEAHDDFTIFCKKKKLDLFL